MMKERWAGVRAISARLFRRTPAIVLVGSLVLVAVQGEGRAPDVRMIQVTTFGAVGNGVADDTRAVQRALDALAPGDTLVLPRGRSFVHSDVLTVRRPDVRVTGGGSLVATDEARSAVVLDADRVTLDDLTLRMRGTSRRWTGIEQHKLCLCGHRGITVRRVTIDGAAAAGVYVGTGASHFVLDAVHVNGTRADGIHVTGGAHDGLVRRPVVSRTGDDGVAVVSYRGDGVPVRRVRIERPVVRANSWGRGISVVGGEDITITGGLVESSSAAGLYIASEGAPYNTFAPRHVRVRGLVVDGANTNRKVDHGAVLVYAGVKRRPPTDVVVSALVIRRTREGVSRVVGVVEAPGARVTGVVMSDVRISGPGTPFGESHRGHTCCTRVRWTVNGAAVPDVIP
jgi:hypothetical protein